MKQRYCGSKQVRHEKIQCDSAYMKFKKRLNCRVKKWMLCSKIMKNKKKLPYISGLPLTRRKGLVTLMSTRETSGLLPVSPFLGGGFTGVLLVVMNCLTVHAFMCALLCVHLVL